MGGRGSLSVRSRQGSGRTCFFGVASAPVNRKSKAGLPSPRASARPSAPPTKPRQRRTPRPSPALRRRDPSGGGLRRGRSLLRVLGRPRRGLVLKNPAGGGRGVRGPARGHPPPAPPRRRAQGEDGGGGRAGGRRNKAHAAPFRSDAA